LAGEGHPLLPKAGEGLFSFLKKRAPFIAPLIAPLIKGEGSGGVCFKNLGSFSIFFFLFLNLLIYLSNTSPAKGRRDKIEINEIHRLIKDYLNGPIYFYIQLI
jgi:hypothetical protein